MYNLQSFHDVRQSLEVKEFPLPILRQSLHVVGHFAGFSITKHYEQTNRLGDKLLSSKCKVPST